MRKEFLVNRQGKEFVLYAGLLDQAHKEGLKRITTKLIQAPTIENGSLAICWAEVETEKGVFTGIGDASPENVGRMIALHTVRMAETRSKARALRDAINVGVTALEELGDLEEDGDGRPRRAEPARRGALARARPERIQEPPPASSDERRTPSAHSAASASPAPGAATQEQINRLQKLQAALGQKPLNPSDLTSDAAAAKIADLVKRFNAQARGIATGSEPPSGPAVPSPTAIALAQGLLVEISSLVYNLGLTDLDMPDDDLPFPDLVKVIDARIDQGIALVDQGSTAKRGKPKADGPVASTLTAYRADGVPLVTPVLSEKSASWLIGALRTVYDAHVANQLADQSRPIRGAVRGVQP